MSLSVQNNHMMRYNADYNRRLYSLHENTIKILTGGDGIYCRCLHYRESVSLIATRSVPEINDALREDVRYNNLVRLTASDG
jgi:hypothetical protein